MFSSVEVPKAYGAQYSARQMKIESLPDFVQASWMDGKNWIKLFNTRFIIIRCLAWPLFLCFT